MSWSNLNNRRELDASKHHSIAEGIKHVISPLSAMLLTYAVAKYNLSAVFRATNNARAYARYYRKYGTPPPPATATVTAAESTAKVVHHKQPHPQPHPHQQHSSSSKHPAKHPKDSSSQRSLHTSAFSWSSSSTTFAAGRRPFSSHTSGGPSAGALLAASRHASTVLGGAASPIRAYSSVVPVSSVRHSSTVLGPVRTGSSVFASLLPVSTAAATTWPQARLIHSRAHTHGSGVEHPHPIPPHSPSAANPVPAAATAGPTTSPSSLTAPDLHPSADPDHFLPEAGDDGLHLDVALAEVGTALSERHRALVEAVSVIYEPACVSTVLHHIYDLPSVLFFEQCLYGVHGLLGTPWWLSITAATLLLRACVLPLNVSFLQHQLRCKKLRPALEEANQVLEDPEARHEDKLAASQTILSLQAQHRCSPYGMWIMPLLFPPLFLSYFASISNLSFMEATLSTGGAAWFADLMAEDPTSILPAVAALSWLAVVENGSGQMYARSGRLRVWARITAVAAIPIMSSLPSAVFMFWIPSNLWEWARIKLLNLPAIRRFFKIPQQSELPHIVPETW